MLGHESDGELHGPLVVMVCYESDPWAPASSPLFGWVPASPPLFGELTNSDLVKIYFYISIV
jgi:hypothetical protein